MKSYIQHIACHLPEKALTNEQLQAENPDWNISELFGITGVKTRYIAAKGETPSDLAVKAGEKLFAEHPELRGQIDFLLFCTQSNDYVTPTTACVIQDRLKLPVTAGAIDFNQGCTGFVYGLAVADGLIQSGTARNILLLTAETISRYIHPRDKSSRFLFGDGAAATLISSDAGPGSLQTGPFVLGSDGSGYESIIIRYGCARHALSEASEEEFTDEFGNVRKASNFYMNGNAVFLFSLRTVPKMVKQLLEKASLTIEDIDCFVFHQANKIILDTLAKKLGIPAGKMVYCLEDSGNIVTSAIPLALTKNRRQLKKGNRVMLVAFGVGYSWSATVVEVN